MCLITFLIPIYNEIRTAENAIKEVVNLDYPKKQIIIIDNNSNDGTKEIIKKFKDLDEVTIILKDKNLGFGDSIEVQKPDKLRNRILGKLHRATELYKRD